MTKKQPVFCFQSHPTCDKSTKTTPPPHLDPTSHTPLPPSLPLHQIVFLPQINKHYQRVTDYGLVEAASVCYSSGPLRLYRRLAEKATGKTEASPRTQTHPNMLSDQTGTHWRAYASDKICFYSHAGRITPPKKPIIREDGVILNTRSPFGPGAHRLSEMRNKAMAAAATLNTA